MTFGPALMAYKTSAKLSSVSNLTLALTTVEILEEVDIEVEKPCEQANGAGEIMNDLFFYITLRPFNRTMASFRRVSNRGITWSDLQYRKISLAAVKEKISRWREISS